MITFFSPSSQAFLSVGKVTGVAVGGESEVPATALLYNGNALLYNGSYILFTNS
jgi:hypothetical protein